jgi:hypothetical protein
LFETEPGRAWLEKSAVAQYEIADAIGEIWIAEVAH